MPTGNTVGRPDAILMDAPWSIHAPKLLLWVLLEGLLIATGIITGRDLRRVYEYAEARTMPYAPCHTLLTMCYALCSIL